MIKQEVVNIILKKYKYPRHIIGEIVDMARQDQISLKRFEHMKSSNIMLREKVSQLSKQVTKLKTTLNIWMTKLGLRGKKYV